jgi:hypothetical protein
MLSCQNVIDGLQNPITLLRRAKRYAVDHAENDDLRVICDIASRRYDEGISLAGPNSLDCQLSDVVPNA